MEPVSEGDFPHADHNDGTGFFLFAHHEKDVDLEAVNSYLSSEYVDTDYYPNNFCLTFWVYCTVNSNLKKIFFSLIELLCFYRIQWITIH